MFNDPIKKMVYFDATEENDLIKKILRLIKNPFTRILIGIVHFTIAVKMKKFPQAAYGSLGKFFRFYILQYSG